MPVSPASSRPSAGGGGGGRASQRTVLVHRDAPTGVKQRTPGAHEKGYWVHLHTQGAISRRQDWEEFAREEGRLEGEHLWGL